MKRFSAAIDRYRAKKTAQGQSSDEVDNYAHASRSQRHAQKKKDIAQQLDDKTVLYICNQYLHVEYGRRGGVAVRAVRYAGSVIIIKVQSALWAQEVWMHRNAIVQHVNKLCGYRAVTKVVAEV